MTDIKCILYLGFIHYIAQLIIYNNLYADDVIMPFWNAVTSLLHIRITYIHITRCDCSCMYSRASVNGPSEKRTTTLQQTSMLCIQYSCNTYTTSEKRTWFRTADKTMNPKTTFNTKLPLNNGHPETTPQNCTTPIISSMQKSLSCKPHPSNTKMRSAFALEGCGLQDYSMHATLLQSLRAYE